MGLGVSGPRPPGAEGIGGGRPGALLTAWSVGLGKGRVGLGAVGNFCLEFVVVLRHWLHGGWGESLPVGMVRKLKDVHLGAP